MRIARTGNESSQRWRPNRWVVERTLAWLHRYRRRRVRDERKTDIHQASLTLGCALICLNHLPLGGGEDHPNQPPGKIVLTRGLLDYLALTALLLEEQHRHGLPPRIAAMLGWPEHA